MCLNECVSMKEEICELDNILSQKELEISNLREETKKNKNLEELVRSIVSSYGLSGHSLCMCNCRLCQLIKTGEVLLK